MTFDTKFVAELLDISEERARSLSAIGSEDDLLTRHEQLKIELGPRMADELIQDGEAALYQGSQFDAYLNLARAAKRKSNSGCSADRFRSIAALKSYLAPQKSGPTQKIDLSNVRLPPLFIQGGPQSEQYLDSLIEDGEVKVKPREIWTKKGKSTGVQGHSICGFIAQQITMVYAALGKEKPHFGSEGGSLALSVGEADREFLRAIRDQAYR